MCGVQARDRAARPHLRSVEWHGSMVTNPRPRKSRDTDAEASLPTVHPPLAFRAAMDILRVLPVRSRNTAITQAPPQTPAVPPRLKAAVTIERTPRTPFPRPTDFRSATNEAERIT